MAGPVISTRKSIGDERANFVDGFGFCRVSVGISDGFLQGGQQGWVIVIVSESRIDAQLQDPQFLTGQFVHRAEDLVDRTHDVQ